MKVERLWLFFGGVVAPAFLLASAAAVSTCDVDLEHWLACNNPRAISYLKKLSAADVGKTLKGFTLTDGTKVLAGDCFLGQPQVLGKGVHIYVFKRKQNRVAYLWVDPGGIPLPLPTCPEKVSHESAYVLSGDVYTWAVAKPGAGVIKTMCIDPVRWGPFP